MAGANVSSLAHVKPIICILDASVGVTGALAAARREAELLADRARFILVVPDRFEADPSDTVAFESVVKLPIRPLRRSLADAIGYFPSLLRSGRELKLLLEEKGCSRLQVNDFYLAEAWVARRLGYRGRIATWIRIDPRRFGQAGKWWLARARAASDDMVTVSHFIKDRISRDFQTKLVYDPAPRAQATNPKGARFLCIGNYTRGKGQDVAIRAFHRLAPDFPHATLVLHGGTFGLAKNEEFRRELEALASNGPGAKRILVGEYASDPQALFVNALAAVNCSESESFSLTCQEAAAHGLPVIATRCGGPEEIIDDGVTGFLVAVGNEVEVEIRMRRLLLNPGLARSMGQRAHLSMQEKFGEARFAEQISRLLDLPATG